MKQHRNQSPTIGHAFEIDKGARLFFEKWLPVAWLERVQQPDVHVDYRVEVVENGEPTALNFLAQIKGRSLYKRKTKKLSEPLKTKHLRYYFRCKEPVFIFLIDPKVNEGHWLFIQQFLIEKIDPEDLRLKSSLVIDFSPQCLMADTNRFHEELKKAWEFLREIDPGSPKAAILAEQRRLESLDPRYSVRIIATETGMKIRAVPRQPVDQPFKLRLPDQFLLSQRELFEKGRSFKVKANEIKAEDSPLLSALLERIGGNPITIESGATFPGCLHLSLNEAGENFILQIDGHWTLAPKRISFVGRLPDSPLKAQLDLDRTEVDKLSSGQLVFNLDWRGWSGQPLLSIGYFDQLTRFANATEYEIIGMIRGNRIYREKLSPLQSETQSKVADAIGWLRKCRDAATRVGINPVLPLPEALDGKEANDVRLLVKLLEDGFHEQTCANEPLELTVSGHQFGPTCGRNGLTHPRTFFFQIAPRIPLRGSNLKEKCSFCYLPGVGPGIRPQVGQFISTADKLTADDSDNPLPCPSEELTIQQPETKHVNFFGAIVPFPVMHTFTDMRFISKTPLAMGRITLAFKGGPNALWRISPFTEPSVEVPTNEAAP